MYAVQLICFNFFCFYLYNVHQKECNFDIFDKPTGIKKELTNVEIQEQTASLLIDLQFISFSVNNFF